MWISGFPLVLSLGKDFIRLSPFHVSMPVWSCLGCDSFLWPQSIFQDVNHRTYFYMPPSLYAGCPPLSYPSATSPVCLCGSSLAVYWAFASYFVSRIFIWICLYFSVILCYPSYFRFFLFLYFWEPEKLPVLCPQSSGQLLIGASPNLSRRLVPIHWIDASSSFFYLSGWMC